ncbi:MAG: ABC transporter permease [Clostridia bacterium]|nr:MAG: ABC transporter permease [Clostridia bacterium]
MKLSAMRYLTREGLRNVWQNRFMSVASVAVLAACLLLTGLSYLALANVERAFKWVYGQNMVVVFAKTDCTDEQITAMGDALKALENVEKTEFLSKEETLEKYKDSLPEETYASLQGEDNPMPDAYLVTFRDLESFDETVAQIKAIDGVDDASYDGNIAATLRTVRRIALEVGLGVVVLLLVVSLFIIANTIKLTVYNRRLEIYIMRSVGATGAFIRVPFMVEGMTLGILSGGVAFFFVWLLYVKLLGLLPQTTALFSLVPFKEVWGVLIVGFLVIGMLTGMLGSAIATGKYLHKEGSEKT